MPLQLDSEYVRPQTTVHNSSVYTFNNNNNRRYKYKAFFFNNSVIRSFKDNNKLRLDF
jgi:hypothetical protein